MARLIRPDERRQWERAFGRANTPFERALDTSVLLSREDEQELFGRRDRLRQTYLATLLVMERTLFAVARRIRTKTYKTGGEQSPFQRMDKKSQKPESLTVDKIAAELEAIAIHMHAGKTIFGQPGHMETIRFAQYHGPRAKEAARFLEVCRFEFTWFDPLFRGFERELLQVERETDPVERDKFALRAFNVSGREAVRHARKIRSARAGITAIQERVITGNVRLVRSIALGYQGLGLELSDLDQAGAIGLRRAVEKFDYKRGYKFSTYATWWIRQAITREIADNKSTVRIPVHIQEFLNKVRRVMARLTVQGIPADPDRIAEELGVAKEKVLYALRAADMQDLVRLDAPIGDDSEKMIGDIIPDTRRNGQRRLDLQMDLARVLARARLSHRQREVVDLRFGLKDGQHRTLEMTGNLLSITRERARQLEARALAKLRTTGRRMGLQEFLKEDK
jgi:RNA polymerase primary sigma factor